MWGYSVWSVQDISYIVHILIDWLILMAYKSISGYSKSRSWEVILIYIYIFYTKVFKSFLTPSDMI